MNKLKIAIITGCILIVTIIGGLYYAYTNGSYYVNATEIEDLTTEAVNDYLEKYIDKHRVFSNKELNDYCVSYKIDNTFMEDYNFLDKIIKKMQNTNFELPVIYKVDKAKLQEFIEKYNENKIPTENASIIRGINHYEVKPEIYGTQVDYPQIEPLIEDKTNINIDDYLIPPTILKEHLEERCNNVNQFVDWHISYDNGQVIQSSIDNVEYTYETDEIHLNSEFITSQIKDVIAPSYNTVGSAREFITHDGTWITISGGTFGTTINKIKETEEATQLFYNAESVDGREPVYNLNLKDIGNTYIEVSLAEQHLWVFKDGVLINESDVVTGQTTPNRVTPTGVYYIMERINGKYLVGENYRTWVDKWMRLTYSGVGLHDAGWRSRFGSNIYTYDGSHGCINLPKSFSYWLFDNVETKTPVIIY